MLTNFFLSFGLFFSVSPYLCLLLDLFFCLWIFLVQISCDNAQRDLKPHLSEWSEDKLQSRHLSRTSWPVMLKPFSILIGKCFNRRQFVHVRSVLLSYSFHSLTLNRLRNRIQFFDTLMHLTNVCEVKYLINRTVSCFYFQNHQTHDKKKMKRI